MTGLWALVRRDTKLYFKDKGMFFSSLITPIILLVLYATFLKNVYADSFRSALGAAETFVSDALVNGCVGGQLVSSLLAVCCVTVAFCSNLLMIRDKTTGARGDLTIAPVRPGALGLGYYLATLFSTLIVTVSATAVCFGYLAVTGWYLSAGDVLLVLLDVDIWANFKNACIMAVVEWRTTLQLLITAGLLDLRGLRIRLRRVYAHFQLRKRPAEGIVLPSGHIRHGSAAQSYAARRFRRNERAGLSRGGD